MRTADRMSKLDTSRQPKRKGLKMEDLYFGVRSYSISGTLETLNLFDAPGVRWSVARYALMSSEERSALASDPCMFCFGDVWGRCEYEFIISSWPPHERGGIKTMGAKVDIFSMYVEPNKDYLMSLVKQVSVTSARKILAEHKKRYKRGKK